MSSNNPSQPVSESHIDWEYTCSNCRRGFNASMAHQIVLIDETEAELMCPWCKHAGIYDPPDIGDIERPPAIVSHTIGTDEQGHSTARVFFDGGAWLQYRETPEGRVREEVFTTDGDLIESGKAEIEYDDCEPAALYDLPKSYLSRFISQYQKFTVRGLRIQRPDIAVVLVPRD